MNEAFFKELGARIAAARKESGMTQQSLAEQLGVSQQTIAHYEVGRVGVGAAMLPNLSELLDLPFDELLVGEALARTPGKRGPTSRLQQKIDAVAQLSKAEQRFVSKMLDNLLVLHQGQESATPPDPHSAAHRAA